MRRSLLLRAAALGTGLLLLAGALAPLNIGETAAAWNDQQVGTAAFSALQKIPQVASTSCSGTPGGLLVAATATVSWPVVAPLPGAQVSYLIKATNSKGATESITQPETSKKFQLGLLDTLLGVLLSSPTILTLEVSAIHSFGAANQWVSPASTPIRVDYMGSLLGLTGGFKCVA